MYPAVKEYLLSFGYDRLKQTGDIGARKKSNNKWFETQDSIGYWEDFSKQKIVWARLMRISKKEKDSFPRFSIVPPDIYTLDSLCFIIGNNLDFLISILNSKIASYYFFNNIAILDNGGLQMRQQYIEKFQIPNINKIDQLNKFSTNHNKENLDELVYDLYELEATEIKYIEQFIERKLSEIASV